MVEVLSNPTLKRWVNRFSRINLLFAASLVLHVLVVLVFGHYRHPILWENGVIVEKMFEGHGFAFGFSRPDELTSWQAPGYPYLIYWLRCLVGNGPFLYLLISLLQCVLAASVIYPMSWLAERWFGERVAVWTRWVVCVTPLLYWYPTRIHQVLIVMAFHPWLLWGWLSLTKEGKRGWVAVLTGVGTGLAGLFQPVMLGIFGAISGAMLLVALRSRMMGKAAMIFGAGLLTLLVLTPWTVRNYRVHGHLVLVKDSFGKEFWLGNNPHSTGTAYVDGGGEEITNVYPPKAMELHGEVSESELMQAMQKEAAEYVKADPGSFVKRTLTKVLWFWTAAPARYARSSGEGEAVKMRWILLGYWVVFVSLAIIAALTTKAWPSEYRWVLGLYFGLYSVIYGLTHVGMTRYRGEMEYIILPAVALGCVSLIRMITKQVTESSRETYGNKTNAPAD